MDALRGAGFTTKCRETQMERYWGRKKCESIESTLELLNSQILLPNSSIQAPNSPILRTPICHVKGSIVIRTDPVRCGFSNKLASENRNCRLGPSCDQPLKKPAFHVHNEADTSVWFR
jgi:hypothetical protein